MIDRQIHRLFFAARYPQDERPKQRKLNNYTYHFSVCLLALSDIIEKNRHRLVNQFFLI